MSSQEHKLAAIMFTDIIEYTSLMSSQEKRAFEILKNNRRLHFRLIRQYKGQMLKEMGDGILASFSSSINAVVCAVAIQEAAIELSIPIRIGIHQGDVVFESKDVLGDSVNTASRIQALADKNGIVISETVYRDVRNKEGLETEFLGKRQLKGLNSEIGVYKLWSPEVTLLNVSVDTGELVRPIDVITKPIIVGFILLALFVASLYYLSPKTNSTVERQLDSTKSILVLPFDNYTGYDSLEYFVSGMHSSLIGELMGIGSFRVLSEHTARSYKEKGTPLLQIAEEQGVNFILEASAMCIGENICIQPRLISVDGEEEQIWIDEYSYEMRQALNLYNQITKQIAKEINVTLTPEEEKKVAKTRVVNPEAYKLFLQARNFWILEGKDNFAKSIEYYHRALEIDSTFALAYVGLAITYNSYGWYQYEPIKESIPLAKKAALKALEMDSTLGEAYTELAFSKLLLDWDWTGSELEFKKALKLRPNDARVYNMFAWLLGFQGRHNEAIENAKIAHMQDPLSVNYWGNIGRHYYFAGEYDKAIDIFHEIIEVFPDKTYSSISWLPRAYEALAKIQKNKLSEAIEKFENTDYEVSWYCYLGYAYGKVKNNDKALQVLKHYLDISDPKPIFNGNIAIVYLGLNEKEKAIDWFERALEQKDGYSLFLKVEPLLADIRSEPRFQKMLQKVGFPE